MELRVRPRPPAAWLHLVPKYRQSEGHISVRWFKTDCPAKVYLNDVDVSNDCVEALADNDGWVVLVDKPITSLDPTYRKEHGVVRVAKEAICDRW